MKTENSVIRDRYLHISIQQDLKKKMIFVGGPRQVGKTTLAQHIGAQDYHTFSYLNWDVRDDRKTILAGEMPATSTLVIFDEIHKYKPWKNYLKGTFDKYHDHFHMLVTGSARLDLYRRGGDSLMGRYHYYRLHPFSLAELLHRRATAAIGKELFIGEATTAARQHLSSLFIFGGFPEPLFAQDERTLRRFHNERVDRLVRGDIRDIESVRDLSALQVLVEILPEKVASLLSLNSLREDMQVAHKTITLWMNILERFYYHFRISPYASTKIKTLSKEPKMYLWDWSEVKDETRRFENMIASHLLKFVHFLYDTEGQKAELFFLRDTEGREVDFLVTIDQRPWFAVEAKWSEKEGVRPLHYFIEKLRIPFSYQVVRDSGIDVLRDGIRVISADKFLTGLV